MPSPVEVLLVEDSPTDALIIGEALIDIAEFDHNLTHAESLADALAHAQQRRFDVVFLDLGLPDGSGIDTFRRFRQVAPDTPVLVLTGLADISVGLVAIQEGAQDYLLKREIQAALLSRAIRYAIERNRGVTALRESREELQRLSAYIEQIREEEKTRIARELHDDMGQLLTALKIDMMHFEGAIESKIDRTSAGALQGLYGLIDQLVASVRRIAADLRPVMLDDLGPIPAIEWFVHEFSARHGIAVKTQLHLNEVTFNRDSGTEVFRMVQEGLTNVARHSGASEASVEIVREAPFCILKIGDNGRGALPAVPHSRKSFGLIGMRERAARLQGALSVESSTGQGFALTVTLPLAIVEAPESDDAGAAGIVKH